MLLYAFGMAMLAGIGVEQIANVKYQMPNVKSLISNLKSQTKQTAVVVVPDLRRPTVRLEVVSRVARHTPHPLLEGGGQAEAVLATEMGEDAEWELQEEDEEEEEAEAALAGASAMRRS